MFQVLVKQIYSVACATLDKLKAVSANLQPLLASEADVRKVLSEMPESVARQVLEVQARKSSAESAALSLLEMNLSRCKDIAAISEASNCKYDIDCEKLVCQTCLRHRHTCPSTLI